MIQIISPTRRRIRIKEITKEMFCQSWFNKEHSDSYQQCVIKNAWFGNICSRETPLYFQLSISVFFHLLNILDIKRMETTSPGELNEQWKSLIYSTFVFPGMSSMHWQSWGTAIWPTAFQCRLFSSALLPS